MTYLCTAVICLSIIWSILKGFAAAVYCVGIAALFETNRCCVEEAGCEMGIGLASLFITNGEQ